MEYWGILRLPMTHVSEVGTLLLCLEFSPGTHNPYNCPYRRTLQETHLPPSLVGLDNGPSSTCIADCALPGICPHFELDGEVNLESIFLQGMLSEKSPLGSLTVTGYRGRLVSQDLDDAEPTEDDWRNL